MLKEIKVTEGSTVGINSVVAILGAEGSAAGPSASAPTAAAPAARAELTGGTPEPTPSVVVAPAGGAAATDVLMPQMGESITEGTITKWLKKVGDTVVRDEPIFEISTDKVDAEIPSPVSGTLTEIKAAEGATVSINTVVAVIGGAAGVSAERAPISGGTPVPTPGAPAPVGGGAVTEVLMPQMGESIT